MEASAPLAPASAIYALRDSFALTLILMAQRYVRFALSDNTVVRARISAHPVLRVPLRLVQALAFVSVAELAITATLVLALVTYARLVGSVAQGLVPVLSAQQVPTARAVALRVVHHVRLGNTAISAPCPVPYVLLGFSLQSLALVAVLRAPQEITATQLVPSLASRVVQVSGVRRDPQTVFSAPQVIKSLKTFVRHVPSGASILARTHPAYCVQSELLVQQQAPQFAVPALAVISPAFREPQVVLRVQQARSALGELLSANHAWPVLSVPLLQ